MPFTETSKPGGEEGLRQHAKSLFYTYRVGAVRYPRGRSSRQLYIQGWAAVRARDLRLESLYLHEIYGTG